MTLASPFSLSIVAITALAFLGLPIGHAMISGSILYLLLAGLDMGTAAEQILNGMYTNYIILAVPLFILAAELMNIGSMTERLLRFCDAVVGRFRGGLAHVNILQSIIFAGMSGSAIADAAGTGKMMQMMMTKGGKYTPSYAAALTAATAVIGPIIPPSIPMILYALVSDASIGFLFLGGVVPGLLMALSQMIIVAAQARSRNFPVEKAPPLKELPAITWRAFPSLMMPVVLLGGIYTGITTPTEAAAVAAAYALLIDRHVDRRRPRLQLRRHGREHSRGHTLAPGCVRPVADRLPGSRQLPAPPLGMRAGRDDYPAHRNSRPHPDGKGARHRHGAFRRHGRGQHHARPGDAALRPSALHHDEDRRGSTEGPRARRPAIPLRHDCLAHLDHLFSEPRALAT
jgi:hypothetical protein